MLSEFPASEIRFTGLSAGGTTAGEAAAALAAVLEQWASSRENMRLLQLTVHPPSAAIGAGREAGFEATATIVYVDTGLKVEDMAEAVAAAVEEIHEAQVAVDDLSPIEDEDRTGV